MRCSFCGADIPIGTGKIVILSDGSYLTFCSRKCEKNYLELKRSPQKVKWTSKYHEEKEIRMYGKEKKEKETSEEEAKPRKKKLSKKERRELRKKKKLEKKEKKKKLKENKADNNEQSVTEVAREGGENQ